MYSDREGLTIRARNDDMELITVLASVNGCLSRHSRTPEGTLEVGDAGWVLATDGWLHAWISLSM